MGAHAKGDLEPATVMAKHLEVDHDRDKVKARGDKNGSEKYKK